VIGAGYVGEIVLAFIFRDIDAKSHKGGPTAAVLALHNPAVKVTVLDRDVSRIASWKSAHLPIHEPGLEPVVRIARDGGSVRQERADYAQLPVGTSEPLSEATAREGNLFFSTDSASSIAEADIIFLAVNTPTKYSGRGAGAASDLAALEGATRDIARFAKNGAIIVEKSTVPCGTANLISEIVSVICKRCSICG
jgi:UDPglucose 6-dehydrogenase